MSFTARPLGSSPTPPVNSLKRKIEQERLRGKDKKKRAKGEPSRPAAAGTYDNAAPSSVESYKEDVPASGPLPIAALRSELVAAVKAHATTIVVGETGSGKSTKLAQYLADALLPRGSGCIVCTQPRRVAAVTIAQRVAAERRGRVGDEVGYSIRFEDKTSKRTRIKFVTDGVLVRECMGDQDLKGYTVVILDEAHERSLQTDILMGLLRQLQDRRADLRLVVMSATLQVDLFMGYFKNPHLVTIPGRQYPVNVLYTRQPEQDYIDAAMLACLQIHEDEEAGGVLVFLPGQDDIEALRGLLDENLPCVVGHASLHTHADAKAGEPDAPIHGKLPPTKGILKDFDVRALYAAMPPDDQLKAFAPADRGVRKFILSTNIAETSVTISGIKYVVDSGFVKTRLIQPSTGIEMLKVTPVSKAQANQRAGRAGRESEGKCYRLFTEGVFEALELVATPEIQRVNVAQVVLQLKQMGVASPMDFPYVSPPSPVVLRKALELLFLLGALGKDQSLTSHGAHMAALPLDPAFAHLLLKSHELRCVAEVVTAVSLLSSDALFVQPYREDDKKRAGQAHRRFANADGDLPTLVSIYEAWLKANKDPKWAAQHYLSQRALTHAASVRQQLAVLLNNVGVDATVSCRPEKEPFLRCLAAGLCLNVARRTVSVDVGNASGGPRKGAFSFSPKPPPGGGAFHVDNITAPYQTVRGAQPVHIHPSSVLFSAPSGRKLPEYVVYAELLITTKHYMRSVTAVDGAWVAAALPSFFKTTA